MNRYDMHELLNSLFSRKISPASADDALDAIPEMVAFWLYLKREYKLKNADAILRDLKKIKAEDYVNIINDSSRFGISKSLVLRGGRQDLR